VNRIAQAARRRLRFHQTVNRDEWYTTRWNSAALKCGWTSSWTHSGYTELRRGATVLRVRGADVGLDSYLTYRIAGNKVLTTERIREAGLPIAVSTEFDALAPLSILKFADGLGDGCVIKPATGTGGGAGVTVGPVGTRMVLRALRDAAAFTRRVRVEERIDGCVIRVLVLNGNVLDAVLRRPAVVVGDGTSKVAELVRLENERRERLGAGSTGYIGTSTDHHAALRRADLTVNSVPRSEQSVVVAGRSNTGSELDSERVQLSEEASDAAVRAAHALGVELAGVDLVIDRTLRPIAVLEVNTGPGLHWHVLVSNEPFDPFRSILETIAET
jgi:cyanophycin synthetase